MTRSERLRFHGKVVIIRLAHWLGCRVPIRQLPTPPPLDPKDLPGRPDLVVAPSSVPNSGLGVFAGRDFAAGEIVCRYHGLRLSTLQALRTPDWRYMVLLGKKRNGRRAWIDARPLLDVTARYINHHFNEEQRNLQTEPLPDDYEWLYRATRAIRAGEELFYDYGRTQWHCFDRSLGPQTRRLPNPGVETPPQVQRPGEICG